MPSPPHHRMTHTPYLFLLNEDNDTCNGGYEGKGLPDPQGEEYHAVAPSDDTIHLQ